MTDRSISGMDRERVQLAIWICLVWDIQFPYVSYSLLKALYLNYDNDFGICFSAGYFIDQRTE